MIDIPVWTLMPFALMLLCIAIIPLFAEKWWANNLHKLSVSLLLGVPVALWMLSNNTAENQFTHHLIHQMAYDYVPFILLLAALFVVTGGIRVKSNIKATPWVNTGFLIAGWMLASLMGTTGAAMLLIRPLISTLSERKFKVHTILFFIALVANCGGLLTPLGDPPLFLLYLRGADFGWFLNLLPVWATVGVSLLLIYYLLDSYYYRQETKEHLSGNIAPKASFSLEGQINFFWLLCVIACVLFLNPGRIPEMGNPSAPFYIKQLREIALVVIIVLSWQTTRKEIRLANHYSREPIMEVAALFLGIFLTMTPALIYLNGHTSSLGLEHPWQFFYTTGLLSSFLDNAPTAVAFHSVASGLAVAEGSMTVAGISEILLKVIAAASVFFGSKTYIGNGPNFMVKSIAEQNGIKMPSFFGYIGKFSLPVLLPIYVLVQLIFFRGMI